MPTNIYNVRPDCQVPGLEWLYCGTFGLKTDGFFVEVGAHDGISYSNTVFLAELGWGGIYLEPIEHLYNRCVENHKNHPHIKVLQVAVGSGQPVNMYRNADTDYLFTGNRDFAVLNQANNDMGEYQTMTLDGILCGHFHLYDRLDLLVIDVEGMEVEVLKGFTLELHVPKMVIIETHEMNANPEMAMRTPEIDSFFLKDGHYLKIFTSAINTIYVRR